MAARVVVLPEPVGPVTRINPRCSSASLRTASGSPISWNEGPPNRSFRRTIEIEPRCRKTFARKRPTFATEYAKSTSPRSANAAFRSCGTMPSAIACVSIGPSGSRSRRIKPWGNRIIGGDPTLTWRSDPSPLTSSSSHELNSGTIGAPVSISSLPGRSIVGRGAARRAVRSIGAFGGRLQSAGRRSSQSSRAVSRQTVVRSARGSNDVIRRAGRDAASIPSSSP